MGATVGPAADEWSIDPAIGEKCHRIPGRRRISRSPAWRTGSGVVGRSQLVAAGIGSRAVEHRLERGRLHALYRGVYAVGHRVRLIVELDGRDTHTTAAAFERDRARDGALTIEGRRVLRVTWRQLGDEPPRLASELHALLDAYP